MYGWCEAHKSSQVVTLGLLLHPNRISEHPGHDIFTEYHNFLPEEFDATRISGKVNLGDPTLQP